MEPTLLVAAAAPSLPALAEPATPPRSHHLTLRPRLLKAGAWLFAVIVLVAAGVFGYQWAFGPAPATYATAAVERGDVESSVVAAGVLQPVKYVDVGAQTSGKLKSLKVRRGDRVDENQLLAEIDPVLAATALTSANATLESMTSQRSVRQAQLVLATAQRSRSDQLFARQMISASDRDISRANYDVAFADLASLSAQMKQATAAVGTATANLGYTRITAPMAGDVVSISMLEGQTLNASQQAPTILRIADLTTMTVWAQVSEADIVRVTPGQDVYFTVLGQRRRWTGTIRQVLPTPELINNVVFYDVLFDVPNPDRALNIQMTAQVYIVLASAKQVLLVPTSVTGNAIQGSTIKVQVLKPDGRLDVRAITIGIKSELSAQVTSGLAEHELVVIKTLAAAGTTRNPLAAGRGY
ncbi:MAG: macrolide transporter subunit MacA [Acidobacteria bacterium]|nr:macrolide transporter subunit MacA [Acidobacteriota bacterium]